MIIKWLPDAAEDVNNIFEYIAKDNIIAASEIILQIKTQVDQLKLKVSRKGRAGRITGTIELVILQTPFITVYRVKGKIIQILRILHSSQEWPDSF